MSQLVILQVGSVVDHIKWCKRATPQSCQYWYNATEDDRLQQP